MENGYLYKHTEKQWYAPSQSRFLPDRYVEGKCYICGYENARSDQCDKCGNLLDPEKLIGRQVAVITNLKAAKLAGIESQGMILSAMDDNGNLRLMTVEDGVEDGAIIG